jgi:ubiquinone/menaquinone biosynthesis C-methylase UbiE
VAEGRDRWAEWLAERRFGGDAATRERVMVELTARREKVLDLAKLTAGETVLDVGCGEGLIGFGALDRGAGSVVFSDVSEDLLAVCRQAALDLGVLDRCRFVQASAKNLAEVEDESVDVVTTRSVLIYVADKRAAFREFARVLRPGGRISIFEPINRFASRPGAMWVGYDFAPLVEIYQKVHAVYEAIQPPSDPMLDFDERHLLELAEAAGFFPLHLLLEAEISPIEPRSWEGFVNSAGNPKIPTFAEAMEQALTESERDRLIAHLRPLVEQGHGEWRMAMAHVYGSKSAKPTEASRSGGHS